MALNAEYVPMADQEYVYIVLKNLLQEITQNYRSIGITMYIPISLE